MIAAAAPVSLRSSVSLRFLPAVPVAQRRPIARAVAASLPAAAAVVATNPGVSDALSAYATGKLAKPVTIHDSAANIAAHFADLAPMAKAGKIAGFTFTEAGKPALVVSAAAVSAGSALLAKLTGASVSVQFSGALADYQISANADGSISTVDSHHRAGESSKFKGVSFFAFSDVSTVADTGDASLNALLSGGTNHWWIDGTGAATSATDIQPGVYGLAAGSARHVLTYSFMSGSLPASASAQDRNGFVGMNATQRAGVERAFAYLSSLINVTFKASDATDGSADINFGMNTQSASAGYATPPNASGNHNVFVMLAGNASTNSSFEAGSYGWETLIHEIGHAMGLKHPGNYNAGGGGASPPYLSSALDNRRYSVMSYKQSADASVVTATQVSGGTSYSASGLNPSTYMREDIAALQFLYGAATSSDAQSAAAAFQTSTFDSGWKGFETLWTPGGAKLDASASTQSTIVDLRPGAFSSINANPAPSAYVASFPKQVQSFIRTNNTYFGYNDVALAYGSSITEADGGSGNDAFFDGGYSATIDGGGGVNVVYLSGSRADWRANGAALSGTTAKDGSLTLSGSTSLVNVVTGQTLSLANIERLKFYDATKVAATHGSVDLMA